MRVSMDKGDSTVGETIRGSDFLELTRARLSQDERLNSLLIGVVTEVKSYADQLMAQIRRLSDIGRALSGERNLDALLEMIVDEARKFTHADAGTLYILENNSLRFKIVQNDSLKIRKGGKKGEAIAFPPVELKESNVSAFVALNGIPVNIPDVYDTNLFDFTGPKKFDEATGYRSKSMLVVPMRNHENDVIGVLQLLNALNPKTGEVVAFSPDYENLSESLASQAAVAITNVTLINDMEKLFESFVQVMATAIDEKSPVTGGHIRRVANLTMVMAETINEQNNGKFSGKRFTPEQLHELRVAAWMHDIGKVTTPVEIIEKAKKLQTIFDRIHYVDLRMQYLLQNCKMEALDRKLQLAQKGAPPEELDRADREFREKEAGLKDIRAFIQQCNMPGEYLEDAKLERLKAIGEMTFTDFDGNVRPFLDEDELINLSIRKGSITEKERKVMQHHAHVTLQMLDKIPFTKKLKNIPKFAGAHHEFINGKGYPLGLKGDEIPFEGKLMAVTDIAEALTAADRPYKKAMPLENVFRILRVMAQNEELDKELVELFINEKVYERYKEQYEKNTAKNEPAN
ncbi:MAG: GAF domain-containing protein [Nitrospinae bacterium]|nr:GAF domain-containing protein [Nitrospinota bacterium]